jgi:hypothetical protein
MKTQKSAKVDSALIARSRLGPSHPASKIAPQTDPIKSPRIALREISTMANATTLGQSELQVLSNKARYPLAAKTTIVATRMIHL